MKGLIDASDALDEILDELVGAGIRDETFNAMFADVEAMLDQLIEVEGEYESVVSEEGGQDA